MRIRVTIDTDKIDLDRENENGYTNGVVGLDKEGVYRAWYGSRSYFIPFDYTDVLECIHTEHSFDKDNHCYDCGEIKDGAEVYFKEGCDCFNCTQVLKRESELKNYDMAD